MLLRRSGTVSQGPPVHPCPWCGRLAVLQLPLYTRNQSKSALGDVAIIILLVGLLTACIGGLLLVALAFLIGFGMLFIPGKTMTGMEHFCQACGRRWRF